MAGAVLGVDCFTGSLTEATRAVIERAASGHSGYACLANVHVVTTAQQDTALKEALDAAWCVFPDGAPVAWLAGRTAKSSSERIAGSELMESVIAEGQKSGLRHFLFGSTPEVLEKLEERLLSLYPGAHIVGLLSPPAASIHELDKLDHVETIRAAGADVVWCALGAPKQELWMAQYAEALAPVVTLGVGAAFDFVAATKPRAPRWMQRAGLEWLHRLVHEPRRLARRYFVTNTEFLLLAVMRRNRWR